MTAYDSSYDPPALVLEAVITSVPYSRPRVRVPALIDTGADITAIPMELVERLRLYPLNRIAITGMDVEETILFYLWGTTDHYGSWYERNGSYLISTAVCYSWS